MKVIAIKPAFYNGSRVRVGDEVDVPEGLKASWFATAEVIKAQAIAKVAKHAKATSAKAEPKALSQAGKDEAKTFIQAHGEKADLA